MRTPMCAALAAALLACAAAPAAAQQPDTLAPPSHAVALQVGQGGSIELWQRLSPRLEAGVGVGFSLSGSRTETEQPATARQHGFAVAPAVKIYLAQPAPVRPFAYVSAGYGRSQTSNEGEATSTSRSTTVFGGAGVGAEWFPVRRVSFGGYGAVSANRQVVSEAYTSPVSPRSTRRATARSFGAFRSGLRVQLYF